jgi:Domain of unknown function (DUF5658)
VVVSAPAVLDVAAPPEPASPPADAAPAPTRLQLIGTGVVVVLLALGAALAYTLIHRELGIRYWRAVAVHSPFGGSFHPVRDSIEFSFGPFLAVMVGSVSLVALRHRLAAFGIFVLLAATPVMQWAIGDLPTDRGVLFRVGPTPLGSDWFGRTVPSLAAVWRAAAIDYGLALLPAAVLAFGISRIDRRRFGANRSTPVRPRARRLTNAQLAGLVWAGFLFWLVLHTHELIEVNGPKTSTDVLAFLPFFLLGAVLSRGPTWRFVPLVAVPVLWVTTWLPLAFAFGIHALRLHDMRDDVSILMPFVWVVAAGLAWDPVTALVSWATTDERRRVVALAVALNVLNVADAAFTMVAVRSGQAVEANPVAAWLGPGVKIVVVGAASVFLARHRPRVLVWLVLAMLAVVAWHVSGFVLDT